MNARNRWIIAFVSATCIASGLVTPTAASAYPGEVDTSFGDNGFLLIQSPVERLPFLATNWVDDAADGGLWLTVSLTDTELVDYQSRLLRLTENGSYDTGFSRDGIRRLPAPVGRPASLADGGVQVAGRFGHHRDRLRDHAFIAHYTASGQLDSSYGDGGLVRTRIPGLLSVDSDLTADGGAVQCAVTSSGEIRVDRTDAAGRPVSDFGSDGTAVVPNKIGTVVSDCQESDAGGALVAIAAGGGTELVRLTATGELDQTYGDSGYIVVDQFPGARTCTNRWLLADGRAMIGCDKTVGRNTQMLLGRVGTDGKVDTTFGKQGFISPYVGGKSFEWYGDMVLAPDGSFWVSGLNYRGGWDWGGQFVIHRTGDGSQVEDYGVHGLATFDADQGQSPTGLAIDAQGRALVASQSQNDSTNSGLFNDGEIGRLLG